MKAHPGTAEKKQLYFFPFAGASFYSYNGLIKEMAMPGLTIKTLELPGRGKKTKEALLSDINDMADYFFNQIKEDLSAPYAFYGHSLGSLLAYEVTLKIVNNHITPPSRLFVSGRGGPCVPSRDKDIGTLSREAFYAKLKEYGGTPDQVLREKELMAFLEPVLRADFIAAGNYEPDQNRKVPLPVTVFNGTLDDVTREDALKWQEITDTPITLKEFKGDHFFIFDHSKAICDSIVHI
jgi:surfactin synthase thioesterase subunit